MDFQTAIKTCFIKYATFDGVACRSEFWWWSLFCMVAPLCVGMLDVWLSLLLSAATLVPYLAVTTRRLHDTGKSGWWQLLYFLPLIGWIILTVWLAQDSKPDSPFNQAKA